MSVQHPNVENPVDPWAATMYVQNDEGNTDMMKLTGALMQRFIMKTPKKINAVVNR